MDVTENRISNVEVFSLSGKLMGGEEVLLLCNRLKSLLAEGSMNLVIDLAGIEWTNSCGLGMLIGLHVSAVNAGGRLALANVDNIRRLLNMTRLHEILDNYESVDEAVLSFEAEPFE